MQIIPRIAATVEALLGTWAEEINQEYPVIQRERKFTPATLARTLILGFLAKCPRKNKLINFCEGELYSSIRHGIQNASA